MEMKEEALKLADAMKGRAKIRRQATNRKSVQEGVNDRLADQLDQASSMIRRLVEELDKQTYKADLLENRLKVIVGSKPLSDEQIDEVSKAVWERPWLEKHREFARAIEERHGIK